MVKVLLGLLAIQYAHQTVVFASGVHYLAWWCERDVDELSDERKCRISGSELENISICLVWPRVISTFALLHGASLYVCE